MQECVDYQVHWIDVCVFSQFCNCCNIVFQKSIPNIFDCNLKTSYQILIIFGTNIPDTTCQQMTIKFPSSPDVCFCTTYGKQIKQKTENLKKTSPTLSIVTWIKISTFNNIWWKYFWHNWLLNKCFSFHLTQRLLLHYLGKADQA